MEVLQKQNNAAEAQKPTTDECVQQGKAAGERQDWVASIESFKHALKIEPGCAEAHCGLALAYAATLDMVKAKEHYAMVEQLDPGLAERFAKSPGGMMVVRGGTIIDI
jgi:Tfp pilus assembly protein PilF